ncbi:hypothetical protein F5J12DRAFT_94756 [Pisolithus orientalis]|uniref:uncharacterized protein n=1 Tax=Pisolithus orientalis TaxID=936130 RepID=UPI0022254F04|nr:uncharacterized protein F5J12DRAFT_94756 [Pisolithus orientalis]KAI6006487.1 hypothetical protein F5J12DRAFT_94756 [Pisolithus orientalis]
MSLKRPFVASPEFESPGSRRGPKRRQLSSPLPPSSPCASSSVLATPRTLPRPWTIPADSPTNPFGRIRRFTHGTTLPPPTSFGRHISLRFQLVHPRADGREFNRDGVYRIVQVPLNYTLSHLRKLIAYIFDPATDDEIVAPYNLRRVSNRLTAILSSSKDKGKARELFPVSPEPVGHLFEVQKVAIVGQHGVIKSGHTWAKSSTARDPYHYPGNDSQGSVFLDDESDDWRWVAEEDLELTKAWPKGCDLSKAIIYHHDVHTQIHISANTKKVPHRKGKGNKPFLFEAYGSVSLSNPEETLRPGAVETTRWNRIGAYDRFLKAEAEKDWSARALDGDFDEDEDEYAEGETDPNMSSATLPSFGLSSSPFLPSESSNPVTPFPAEPSLRRRVDYERRRLVKLTKEGLKDTSGDEEDEVDELVYDNNDPAKEEKPGDWDPFLDGEEIC